MKILEERGERATKCPCCKTKFEYSAYDIKKGKSYDDNYYIKCPVCHYEISLRTLSIISRMVKNWSLIEYLIVIATVCIIVQMVYV